MMMVYYYIQHIFDKLYPDATYPHMFFRLVPSIAYSCVVIPLNMIYKLTAVKLTSWGNTNVKFLFRIIVKKSLFKKIIELNPHMNQI